MLQEIKIMSVKLDVYNQEGKKTGSQEVPETVFGLPQNDALVHQVYISKLANTRRPYAHTKTRGEVRGGGRKPWRQKGTGRARHGSTRSPIWVGGGVTFGPRNDRVFTKKVNKKMNRKAIVTALSAKAAAGNIYIIESLEYPELKTKHGANLIMGLGIQGKSAVVYGTTEDKGFSRVLRNLPRVKPVNINRLNILDILNNKYCIISKKALTHVINQYANTSTHIQKESGEGKTGDSEEKTEGRKAARAGKEK